MKATSYVFGILFAGALSMGCVAQAGTDEASQAEQGLTIEQQNPVQAAQNPGATAKQRVQLAPRTLTQPVDSNQLQQLGLEELTGTDPGETVTDDGDGKEPDPHPWHVDTATRASH